MKVWVPLADGCFTPTMQVDVRTAPRCYLKCSAKEFQPSQMKLYFIMLPGLGIMPVNCSPWHVSHHLELRGKRKVNLQSARLQPSMSDGNTFMRQLSRRMTNQVPSPYPWNSNHNFLYVQFQSLEQGTEQKEWLGMGWKFSFSCVRISW